MHCGRERVAIPDVALTLKTWWCSSCSCLPLSPPLHPCVPATNHPRAVGLSPAFTSAREQPLSADGNGISCPQHSQHALSDGRFPGNRGTCGRFSSMMTGRSINSPMSDPAWNCNPEGKVIRLYGDHAIPSAIFVSLLDRLLHVTVMVRETAIGTS